MNTDKKGMNILDPAVNFSSIVKIGEDVSKLEASSDRKFLKLHRGVMDVVQIDLGAVKLDLDSKRIHQYSANDGDVNLILKIKEKCGFSQNHNILVTPGGMPSLDLAISSLSDKKFWLPKYHWGSWNKILKIYDKNIQTYDDFNLDDFAPDSGVVMICYPSNPTGWIPDMQQVYNFIKKCLDQGVVIILDIPYYFLFFDKSSISHLFLDNVIVTSSFSKDLGLSGLRVGYISTTNKKLFEVLRTRALYKYNSVSNLSQDVIYQLLSTQSGLESIKKFRDSTTHNISKNIFWLAQNDLLFSEYPTTPVGPFAIINLGFNRLMDANISSVPLNKFTICGSGEEYSRISVAVDNRSFVEYMSQFKLSYSNL